MSQLASAITFYGHLRSLIQAGFAIDRALELAGERAPVPYRTWAVQAADYCRKGGRLAEILARCGERPLVCALVEAGERSGALVGILEHLIAFDEQVLAARRLVIARSIYPVMVLHLALIVVALPGVIIRQEDPLWLLAGPAALWAVAGVLVAIRSLLIRSGLLDRLLLLPGLGYLTRQFSAGSICLVLRAAGGAGMLHPEAIELAAGGCGNQVMGARLRAAARDLRHGRLPSLVAALATAHLPAETLELLAMGEQTGQLDQTCERAATLAFASFQSRLIWTAKIAAGILYGLAVIVTVIVLITTYAQYLNSVMKTMEGM